MASLIEHQQQPNFQFGGGREVVSADKAAELLACLAPFMDNPRHIQLSNKSFTSEAATLIASKLSTFKNIEVADISDIIAGRPEDDALLTLKIICDSIAGNKLVELNVSDNALGAKGVNSCHGVITCKTLQRLYVCNNGLSAEAAELIAQLLMDKGCPPLTLLHFYNNMSGNGGAVAIGDIVKACPQLEDFRFSATRSSYDGCNAIARAIDTLSQLRRLDLSDNSFDMEAAGVLATGLRKQPLLVHLNLRDCGLGEEGTSVVMLALRETASQLEFLDLSGNDITVDQAEDLRSLLAVPSMSLLKELALDDNELGPEGAIAVAGSLRSLKQLETLSMCTCEINAAGAYIVACAVSKLARFSTLKIDGNLISARGVEEMTAVLTRKGKLLVEMEDNDEDGDDEGLEDALAEEEAGAGEPGDDEEDTLVAALEATLIDK